MDYVLDLAHKWTVVFGLLNGTAYWQVRDSTKQNGTAKKLLAQEKRKILEKKIAMGGKKRIETTDIVPMCNRVFLKSFANIKGNKHAIALGGWNPLNRNVLLHPEIVKTRIKTKENEVSIAIRNTSNNTDINLLSLNWGGSESIWFLGKMNVTAVRYHQSAVLIEKEKVKQEKDKRAAKRAIVEDQRRQTAGRNFKNGVCGVTEECKENEKGSKRLRQKLRGKNCSDDTFLQIEFTFKAWRSGK